MSNILLLSAHWTALKIVKQYCWLRTTRENLADKIIIVLEDGKLREQLRRNALEYAKQFS